MAYLDVFVEFIENSLYSGFINVIIDDIKKLFCGVYYMKYNKNIKILIIHRTHRRSHSNYWIRDWLNRSWIQQSRAKVEVETK